MATNSNGTPQFGKGQPKHFCGKKGRSGPKKGCANAQRHGMKGGKLPAGCGYIENRCNALRRQMEEAVLELRGEIGIMDAAAINSILKWERHGLLAAHWLRKQVNELSAGDRLRFSEAIAKASDARDRNIRALGLNIAPEPQDLKGYLEATAQRIDHNGDDGEDVD